MRARRALLYMPGDDLRKIRKATTLDVDCVCLDMEDGVAANRKAGGARHDRRCLAGAATSAGQSAWRASTRRLRAGSG